MVGILLIADDSGSTDATDFTTWNTGTDPDLDNFFIYTTDGSEWDCWETWNRQFVSDMPWYSRFIIWLFPRMFWLEDYP